MEAIIIMLSSCIGACFADVDYFVLHTCISTAIAIYKDYLHYTNDKTAKR